MASDIIATIDVDETENEIEVSADEIKIVFTSDHSRATNRDLPNQHPIKAIDGLEEKLGTLEASIDEIKEDVVTEFKTINGQSITGSGNILIEGGSSSEATSYKAKSGLRVAIIGDSISTHPNKNVSEVEIKYEDIGISLSSFITYYDVGKTISLDGQTSSYTIVEGDIGSELSFIPCLDDVGKKLGTPLNYNSIKDVWWQVASEELEFEPIAVCWSGSSITSHTASSSSKAISYAWHDSTIRKLGTRKSGSMERIAPDVVLIYRGTNDLSHSTKVRLTSGYFDNVTWEYPTTDVLEDSSTYGYKEGLALTIQKIRTTYPKAIIVLCTCNVFKRSDYDNFPTNNGYFSIPQMNTAIREVAEFFGCHVIDLDKCGITFENCYDSGYITDSSSTPTHPNSLGHSMMAKQAISDLIHKVHIYDIEPIASTIDDDSTEEDNTSTSSYIVNPWACWSDGKESATSGYFAYVDYPIEGGATYSVPYGRNYFFEDSTHTYISGGAGAGASDLTITTPSNASYITICFKTNEISTSEASITKVSSSDSGNNDTETTIYDYESTLTSDADGLVSAIINFRELGLIDETSTISVSEFVLFNSADSSESYNLIDSIDTQDIYSIYLNCTVHNPSTSYTVGINYEEVKEQNELSDYIVNPWACWGTGTESATSGYFSIVDYPVEANTTYSIPYGRNYFFEDSTHTYISGGAGGGASNLQITTPENASYITICFKPDEISEADVSITKVE